MIAELITNQTFQAGLFMFTVLWIFHQAIMNHSRIYGFFARRRIRKEKAAMKEDAKGWISLEVPK